MSVCYCLAFGSSQESPEKKSSQNKLWPTALFMTVLPTCPHASQVSLIYLAPPSCTSQFPACLARPPGPAPIYLADSGPLHLEKLPSCPAQTSKCSDSLQTGPLTCSLGPSSLHSLPPPTSSPAIVPLPPGFYMLSPLSGTHLAWLTGTHRKHVGADGVDLEGRRTWVS